MNILKSRETDGRRARRTWRVHEPVPHGATEAGPLQQASLKFHLLLLPGFSQLSLSSFIDPLNCANSLTGRRSFEWQTVGLESGPVVSSNGIAAHAQSSLDDCEIDQKESGLVVIGADRVEEQSNCQLAAFLRRQFRRNLPMFAIGTATWLLAEAGALRYGARCTIHWTKLGALAETFGDLMVEDALFVHDGNLTTCAGDFAAFDLATELIERRCGSDAVRRICQHLAADRWRAGGSCQSVPPGLRYAGTAEKLMRAVKLMERHIEDPIPLEDVAREVSLSRRQIERLFEKYLKTTPWQHYLTLRLQKAKQLLEMTNMPVIDVAVACGYVSSSHFSKSFRDHFQILPSAARMAATSPSSRSAA